MIRADYKINHDTIVVLNGADINTARGVARSTGALVVLLGKEETLTTISADKAISMLEQIVKRGDL